DELRVHVDLERVRPPLRHLAEAVDQGQVLRPVVRGRADVAMAAPQPHALVVLDHHAQAGRAGVAASGAVREEPQDLHATTRTRPQLSHWTRPARRIACIPLDVTVTRQARHWPLTTSATRSARRLRTR